MSGVLMLGVRGKARVRRAPAACRRGCAPLRPQHARIGHRHGAPTTASLHRVASFGDVMGADAFAHSLYERLGCAATSQPHEIRAAYLDAVASKLHPDQGGSPQAWAAIQQAFDTLIDSDSRLRYDEAESDSESDSEDGVWSAAWTDALDEFDLCATLGVRCEGGVVCGGQARIRACYAKLAPRRYPSEACEDIDVYTSAVLAFRRISLAFKVLKDAARFQVYLASGFRGLRASEGYQEESVFDADPCEVYDDFFAGRDPADREFLLLNGADRPDDGWGEDKEEEPSDDEPDLPPIWQEPDAAAAARRAAALSAPPPPLPVGMLPAPASAGNNEGDALPDDGVWSRLASVAVVEPEPVRPRRRAGLRPRRRSPWFWMIRRPWQGPRSQSIAKPRTRECRG